MVQFFREFEVKLWRVPCSKCPYQATVKVMATKLNRVTEDNRTVAHSGRPLGILDTSGEFGNLMDIPHVMQVQVLWGMNTVSSGREFLMLWRHYTPSKNVHNYLKVRHPRYVRTIMQSIWCMYLYDIHIIYIQSINTKTLDNSKRFDYMFYVWVTVHRYNSWIM